MHGKKRIGLKQTSNGAAGTGVVTHVGECDRWDGGPGVYRVRIRHGDPPKPPKEKKGSYEPEKEPPTTELKLPRAVAQKLRIGQKVRISVEPV